VRDQLESSEAALSIATTDSGGSIKAERRTSDGWVAGMVSLSVKSGELVARAGAHGAIEIERLAVDLGPIAIPRTVLGYEAQLTDVHVEAIRPPGVVTTWTGDDAARATAAVDLQLSWSLTIDGKKSPLGAPQLPPVGLELELTGEGGDLHAEVRASSTGMFWSWADLVKLEDLTLVLGAASANP
jgi:hypothetical protein